MIADDLAARPRTRARNDNSRRLKVAALGGLAGALASYPVIVTRSLAAVPGVSAVEVSLGAKTATVTYDDARASADALTEVKGPEVKGQAGFPSRLKEGQGS